LQVLNIKQMASKTGDDQVDSIRQALAQLPSDAERIKLLLQLSASTEKDNPKLALLFLGEAQKIVSSRATNYSQFDNQIKVAHAFMTVDPAKGFEILEQGINQLNELLPAAALLSGFEINLFQDGEMPLRNGSRLTNTVLQYAQELQSLSKVDFERARQTADRFQLSEPRILARLAVAQGILGGEPAILSDSNGGGRGFGQPPPFRQQ
jgi:hypothetical protein